MSTTFSKTHKHYLSVSRNFVASRCIVVLFGTSLSGYAGLAAFADKSTGISSLRMCRPPDHILTSFCCVLIAPRVLFDFSFFLSFPQLEPFIMIIKTIIICDKAYMLPLRSFRQFTPPLCRNLAREVAQSGRENLHGPHESEYQGMWRLLLH
jgi:hypothetical protein